LPGKIEKLITSCPDADTGTLAVTQLLANEPAERAGMFAYAVYPAALSGKLRIGSEGISDLGKEAAKVLDVDGKLEWRSANLDMNFKNPDWVSLKTVLDAISGKRRERAAQFFNYLYVNEIRPDDRAALEEELEECVTRLRSL